MYINTHALHTDPFADTAVSAVFKCWARHKKAPTQTERSICVCIRFGGTGIQQQQYTQIKFAWSRLLRDPKLWEAGEAFEAD